MAKVGPVSLADLLGGRPASPKVVTSKTGEVLVGDEVDELIKGDGLHAAAPSRYRRSVSKPQKREAVGKSPARDPLRTKPSQMVQVIPQVMGKKSLSYGSDGKAIHRKSHKKGKRRKKNKNIGQFFERNISGKDSPDEPVTATAAQYHLGKKDTPDGAKGWSTYRDKNRFGSFSIHDPHGDESGAD